MKKYILLITSGVVSLLLLSGCAMMDTTRQETAIRLEPGEKEFRIAFVHYH